MTKLDQALITELKTLMKKKNIYRLVSLDDVLAGQSGIKKIDVYRARYLRNTCPNVFCDRTVSLGYVGSSTRTVFDMGFSSDGDVVRTSLSGRKLCGLFIDKTLVDLSWEEFSSKVTNKLEKLVVAARDITEIINECPTSYWMLCGWVMYGQTVNSSGEIIVSNFKKAHVIDLIPCMTPETREIVESQMIKGDMVTSSTPNRVPDGSDADNGGPSDAQ
ncbi:hypothetical protein FOZ62_029535 [Perkinsus olseni]|uniref:Uncharacterized protein n=1 Tax=Perkinsus olseni TaxID=32597 RepID=A0A7J6S6N2_PEROL|nr:hypothetical protein FOZ62_029535 [Perkinsus olseni]